MKTDIWLISTICVSVFLSYWTYSNEDNLLIFYHTNCTPIKSHAWNELLHFLEKSLGIRVKQVVFFDYDICASNRTNYLNFDLVEVKTVCLMIFIKGKNMTNKFDY